MAATTLGAGASLLPGAAAQAAGSRGGAFRLGWRWPARLAPKRRPPKSTRHGAVVRTALLGRAHALAARTPEPERARSRVDAEQARPGVAFPHPGGCELAHRRTGHRRAVRRIAQCAHTPRRPETESSVEADQAPPAHVRGELAGGRRHDTRRCIGRARVGPPVAARAPHRIVDSTSPIAPKFADQVVGNGPFVCVEWSTDHGIIARRYDGHYDDDLPRVDAVALQNYDGTKGAHQVAGLSTAS